MVLHGNDVWTKQEDGQTRKREQIGNQRLVWEDIKWFQKGGGRSPLSKVSSDGARIQIIERMDEWMSWGPSQRIRTGRCCIRRRIPGERILVAVVVVVGVRKDWKKEVLCKSRSRMR
jgi:hypothetical protein